MVEDHPERHYVYLNEEDGDHYCSSTSALPFAASRLHSEATAGSLMNLGATPIPFGSLLSMIRMERGVDTVNSPSECTQKFTEGRAKGSMCSCTLQRTASWRFRSVLPSQGIALPWLQSCKSQLPRIILDCVTPRCQGNALTELTVLR